MTRKECLDKAAECVLQDRASQYGAPEDNFGRIAQLWSDYIGVKLDGIDVAMLMVLLKVARIRSNKAYDDGYIDLAGYAACGAELAGKAEAYKEFIEKWGEEYKKLRAKAEGDAKAEDCGEQAFQVGEHVQYRIAELSEGARWLDAWYLERHPNGRGHIVKSKAEGRIAVDPDKIRKAPRAEGCEELYQHIVDCNPATFGRSRTPTGEDLAEMAEEDETHE